MILASFDFTNVISILVFFAIGFLIGWWIWRGGQQRLERVQEKNGLIEREISAVESEVRALKGGAA